MRIVVAQDFKVSDDERSGSDVAIREVDRIGKAAGAVAAPDMNSVCIGAYEVAPLVAVDVHDLELLMRKRPCPRGRETDDVLAAV
jgi:hypothetical protein